MKDAIAIRIGQPSLNLTLDSGHRGWLELHEDLIATRGLDRGIGR